jgi:hypothetical protein
MIAAAFAQWVVSMVLGISGALIALVPPDRLHLDRIAPLLLFASLLNIFAMVFLLTERRQPPAPEKEGGR